MVTVTSAQATWGVVKSLLRCSLLLLRRRGKDLIKAHPWQHPDCSQLCLQACGDFLRSLQTNPAHGYHTEPLSPCGMLMGQLVFHAILMGACQYGSTSPAQYKCANRYIVPPEQFTQQHSYVNTANAIAESYLIRQKGESNQECQYPLQLEQHVSFRNSRFGFADRSHAKLEFLESNKASTKSFSWFFLRLNNLFVKRTVLHSQSKMLSQSAINMMEGRIYTSVVQLHLRLLRHLGQMVS